MFGERNQLPQVVGRYFGVCDDQNGRARHRRDWHKIVQGIERHVHVYVRIDRDVAELNESDRIAVRRGFRDRLRAEIAAAAGRFSITILCPNALPTYSAVTRAATSMRPPAAVTTTSRMGRVE